MFRGPCLVASVLVYLCRRSEHYKLDAFFGPEDSINQLFDREVSTVIPGIFEGINATVFAYGATGSGKTYTMQVPTILLSLDRNVFDEMPLLAKTCH